MDENCQYGIWKNCLPFHAMPCRQLKSNKIAYKVNLPAFLNTISCFILSRDVEAEAVGAVTFLWKRKHYDKKDWKRKRTRKRLALPGSGSKKFQR